MVRSSRAAALQLICCGQLLCAALLCVQVKGHGYMFEPISRNWLGRNSNPVITYTPHGGNGRGVCGDPFEGGGEAFATMSWGRLGVAGTYSPGQRVTIRVRLTANHGGRFAFQICDRTSNLGHACFNRFLTRADVAGERYWWLFSQGAGDYSMDFVFPSDFSCPNGCVMRWEYVATQTCVPPGCNAAVCRDYSRGGNWGVGQNPGLCTDGLARTELFYNCADIRISGTSSGCTSTCAVPSSMCQTGGGCNTATRTCNPITNSANGAPCPGGTCQNGACIATPTGCPTPCTAPNACQTGGGCNTATRTCNPIRNSPNGTPCSGGTCQNGVCSTGPSRCTRISTNGACGNGVCCTAGNCCSQYGWCGATTGHCGTNCQAAWSGIGSTCNGVRISSAKRRKAAIAAAQAAADNATLASAAAVSPTADASYVAPDVGSGIAAQQAAVLVDPAAASATSTAAVAGDVGGVELATDDSATAVGPGESFPDVAAGVVPAGATEVAAVDPAVAP